MWLVHKKQPPPVEHTWLLHAHAATPQRPNLWRRFTGPAAVEQPRQHHHDFLEWHRAPPAPLPVTRRLGDAAHELEEEAEAGCFRLFMRAARWYLWHRWRASHR